MSERQTISNEERVAKAFDRQAPLFDALYNNDPIIRYKRMRVRAHVMRFLDPNASILELNAGTGEDALYFASAGHRVHATDLSGGMLELLRGKRDGSPWRDRISMESCSFNRLDELEDRGPYDLIFSNFAGLNCTGNLGEVLRSLGDLLKPGGRVTLVILPSFCLWESLLVFKGKFRTAFRRFAAWNGRAAKVEDTHFRCWYYQPSYVRKKLGAEYDLESLEGLCSLVPPSYIEGFAQKYPNVFQRLCQLEERMRFSWPWRSIGDYYIITLRKK